MSLTLEISPSSIGYAFSNVHVFGEEGGTIGRANTCSWVLAHPTVSSLHAEISWKDGIFYLRDTDSRNGVALNSPEKEILPNKLYPLKSGDRIYIEPFEIRVSVDPADGRRKSLVSDDVSLADPFGPTPVWHSATTEPPAPAGENEGLNPDDYFESVKGRKFGSETERRSRSDADIPGSRYHEPSPFRDQRQADPTNAQIPPGWVPQVTKAPNSSRSAPDSEPIRPRPGPDRSNERRQPNVPVSDEAFAQGPTEPFFPEVIRSAEPPKSAPVEPASGPIGTSREPTRDVSLPALLEGAGIPASALTPELAGALGAIMRIVVTGLMDVLQSRQAIKHELGIEHTIFRPKGNNPLKFSTDVHDALHNLFVKRNPAYLGPVEAFADAFDDLRDHELAMLAGTRAAFNSMLAEFEPSHLEREFERHLGKAGVSLLPLKMRYWDLYRDRAEEMTKDQETTFLRLFGETFIRAYEDHFREAKERRANRPPGGRVEDEKS